MRSAMVLLPRDRTLFTTWVTRTDLYTGSGRRSLRSAGPLGGTSGLLLRAVARPCLVAFTDSGGVESPTDHLVPDARQVLHTSTADEDDRVLLEVVTDTRDVRTDLDPTGEAHPGHLAEGGVRLLRSSSEDTRADTPSLGRTPEGRRLGFGGLGRPPLADELLNGRHALLSLVFRSADWACGRRSRPANGPATRNARKGRAGNVTRAEEPGATGAMAGPAGGSISYAISDVPPARV